MDILFIAGFAPIAQDSSASKALYQDALGLPLTAQDDYLSMDGFGGVKHYGVWPLRMAAQSCFGTDAWPEAIPRPQATIEFELRDARAVADAVAELKGKGYTFIHDARQEPWGQTVARLLGPEGLLIGLSFAPWLHESTGTA